MTPNSRRRDYSIRAVHTFLDQQRDADVQVPVVLSQHQFIVMDRQDWKEVDPIPAVVRTTYLGRRLEAQTADNAIADL